MINSEKKIFVWKPKTVLSMCQYFITSCHVNLEGSFYKEVAGFPGRSQEMFISVVP